VKGSVRMSVLLRRAALSVLTLSACLLVFAAACADSDTAGPTDIPTDGASVTPGLPTDSATPALTERPSAPADWAEYSDQDGRFSLRYPADWYGDVGRFGGAFYSFDPSSATGPPEGLTPYETKVEASITEARGLSGCGGALNLDPSGEVDSIDPQATETTLGGQPAREIVRDDHGFWLNSNPWDQPGTRRILHTSDRLLHPRPTGRADVPRDR